VVLAAKGFGPGKPKKNARVGGGCGAEAGAAVPLTLSLASRLAPANTLLNTQRIQDDAGSSKSNKGGRRGNVQPGQPGQFSAPGGGLDTALAQYDELEAAKQ
jgi:hypothetical protein